MLLHLDEDYRVGLARIRDYIDLKSLVRFAWTDVALDDYIAAPP